MTPQAAASEPPDKSLQPSTADAASGPANDRLGIPHRFWPARGVAMIPCGHGGRLWVAGGVAIILGREWQPLKSQASTNLAENGVLFKS